MITRLLLEEVPTVTLLAALIYLLPLLSSAVIGLFGVRLRDRSATIGMIAVAGAFLLSGWTLSVVSADGPIRLRVFTLSLTPTVALSFDLFIDRLGAVMMTLITCVSLVIHQYSARYMHGERGYARFFALLGVMTVVLLALVSSSNLLMVLAWWQLVSWLLYLLLAYNYTHVPAIQTAFKTWIVLRLGDVAFLAAVLLAYDAYGTLEFPDLFARAAERAVTFPLWPGGPEVAAATAITLLLFVGAMAKSAQFPVHVWLPDSMDAPTPVSALMHAGIVNAGGFLINRLAPLYGSAPSTLHVVLVIGGLTAVIGATIMLTQSDVKKMLGFSTMAQMGYMIMECGLGAFALAIFHLIAHGIFKATLFLYAGNVIHRARKEPGFPPRRNREPHAGETARILPWAAGVVMTLLLPLIILLAAHHILGVPLLETHGTVVFLFFAWATSSQVLLSLYRLRVVGSWQVASVMVLALFMVVITYLWAAEQFTEFLYPAPGEAASYFEAAALPGWWFDVIVIGGTAFLIAGWVVVYTDVSGRHVVPSRWVQTLGTRLYMWFWNRLYIDLLYAGVGSILARVLRRLDAALPEWLP